MGVFFCCITRFSGGGVDIYSEKYNQTKLNII